MTTSAPGGTCFVFSKVQVIVSEDARSIVAVAVPRLVVVLLVGSVHVSAVSVQVAGMLSSEAVYAPAGRLKDWLLGSVASPSLSREKFWLTVLPFVRLKLKSCASSGTASLTMTIVPFGVGSAVRLNPTITGS